MKSKAKLRRTFRGARQKTAKLWHNVTHKLKIISPLRLTEDALLLVAVLQLGLLGMNIINSDRPILGARLEGQLVGRLGGGDTQKELTNIVQSYENKLVPVQVADVKSSVTMRQLGVNINEEQVRNEVLSAGREGNLFFRWLEQNRAALGLLNVQLQNDHFNNDMGAAYIATLNPKIDISPQNAYFVYQNQVIIVSDHNGRTIDTDKAIQLLRNTDPLSTSETTLPTKVVPAQVTTSMLQTILPEVQKIAQKPLTITAGSSQTTLSPEQLVSVVVPKVITDPNDPTKTTVQVTYDEAKLNAIVDEVVGRAVVTPKPTIMSGGKVIQQGKDGIKTEDSHALAHVLKALIQRQTGAAAPDAANIPLVKVTAPVVVQQPKASSTPRTRTGTGGIHLTFDDGPGGYTNQILDILKRYNVRATFYVIGRNVESYPDTMKRIKNEGHRIGNHSYSHPDLAKLSRGGVVNELTKTQEAILAACGVKPTAFRPPYGSHNATVRSVAAEMGMSVDMWSIDTRDWAKPGSSVITRRVLDNTHSGGVVLLHVLNQQTVQALPSIIEGVRAQGYTLE